MGIVSWIKNKYYDYRLNKADRLVEEGKLDRATLIYESLLGKHSEADVHLANMLVDNASSVNDKIDILGRLLELREYATVDSITDFNDALNKHIASMESLAAVSFNNHAYSVAVNLQEAIKDFRNTKSYYDTLSRYKAYLAFDNSQSQAISKHLYHATIASLNQISSFPVSDIKEFLKILENQNRFIRATNLLLQLQSVGNWVKERIFNYTIKIISGNDSEVKKVKSFSDFCDDKEIAKDVSLKLAQIAVRKASDRDYGLAVILDRFASEYLSNDNSFNFARCQHILEELSSRADAREVKALNELASSLKLTSAQKAQLDRRINEIVVATTAAKAIAICRLYLQNPQFDKVYLERALSLAKAGESLNLIELKKVIGYQTDYDSMPDVLATFVPYLPAVEQDFVHSAIVKIKAKKSEDLLDKYWKVKPDIKFITSLLDKDFEKWKEFASHIAASCSLYLFSAAFMDSFCVAVSGNEDLVFTLSLLEGLLKNGADVNEFYVKVILDNSAKTTEIEESLSLINRGIKHVVHGKLLIAKKSIISKLIKFGKLDRAEEEIYIILNLDEEAPTLLAELYFERANKNHGAPLEYEWLFKVLNVNDDNQLLKRFDSTLNKSLDRLSQLSRQFYSGGNQDKAYEIAERLAVYSLYWIPLYSWLRSQDLESGATLNEALLHDAITIVTISKQCPACRNFESEEFISLWSRYIANTVKKARFQPKAKAILNLNTLKSSVDSFAPPTFATEKINEITNLTIKLKWALANEYEYDLSFAEAIALYEEIVGDKVQPFEIRAELRALICYLKSNSVGEEIETRIDRALGHHSYQALREDLAYRFACHLLQSLRPYDAENVLRLHLPDETQLLNMCENIYIKEAENKLAEFNLKIKAINEGKMSLDEAIEFKNSIHGYKKRITGKLSDLRRPFSRFVPMVESYILRKMFEEEAYVELLNKLMQENPNYVENDIDFHNVAIAALGIIESDEKDKPTLMRAIATVLTAIYKDRLFVQSLEYTSWDDKYSFSLEGSLGQTNSYDYDDLPYNVNFDTPVENENIAIRDVQTSLLTRVEASVRKHHPELEKFCASEKGALDKLIDLNLDKEYILASPHLCRTLASLRMSIGNAFEYELDQNYGNREDVIALGVDYGFSDGEYRQYRNAYNSLQACKNALATPEIALATAFNTSCISNIKKYKKLVDDLKSSVGTAMNEDIRSKMDFRTFLSKYEIICNALGDTTLSFTCSNYVNGEVVHLLNNDDMELRDGVGYMVRIFNLSPGNFQVKKNLEGILSNLAILVVDKSNANDKQALNMAVADTGNAFKSLVEDVTIQASLSGIVEKVNNDRMRKNTALSEVYKLYQKNPNNDRICENLVTLCEMCIFEYIIKDSYEASGVKTTLNALKRNMSATFKQKATKLSNSYYDILDSLPLSTQILLRGDGSFAGESLNAKGYALKAGLEYFRTLGSVSSANRPT